MVRCYLGESDWSSDEVRVGAGVGVRVRVRVRCYLGTLLHCRLRGLQ